MTTDDARFASEYDQYLARFRDGHRADPAVLALLAAMLVPPHGNPEAIRTAKPSVVRAVIELAALGMATVELAALEGSDG
jgi:hypothetical protein